MNFGNLRVILEYFLKANPMVRPLYTSADMKKDISIPFDKDISITSDAVDRFLQSKCNFWVVFQGKSNSEVTVHIS